MIKRLFIFALIALPLFSALTSCRVTLAQKYNESIVADIQEISSSINNLNINIRVASTSADLSAKNYENFAGEYTFIETQFEGLLFSLKGLEKTALSIKMVTLAKDMFIRQRLKHQTKNTLNGGEADIHNKYMQDELVPILQAQLSLRPKVAEPAPIR